MLIARGEVLPGMRLGADALAHAILRHPPRFWIAQGAKLRARESGSAATLAEGSDT